MRRFVICFTFNTIDEHFFFKLWMNFLGFLALITLHLLDYKPEKTLVSEKIYIIYFSCSKNNLIKEVFQDQNILCLIL